MSSRHENELDNATFEDEYRRFVRDAKLAELREAIEQRINTQYGDIAPAVRMQMIEAEYRFEASRLNW